MNIPSIYRPFFAIVCLFSFIFVVNIPILETLWKYSFDDGTYSHAYLIPFISLYLYFKLSEIGKLTFKENVSIAPGLLLLTASLLLLITSNAQVSVGYWLSILAVILASIMTLFRFNWYVIFPACFLIFIIPMWGILTGILQSISVSAVTYMMHFTNIPTYVETEFITIPAGTFEIADGCSGLRYIIVSLAISSLFIFLYITNMKKALIFFTFAILGALLTNWIRITALIIIGDYTDMQSSLMEDHNTFGWYLYIPYMVLLFIWGNKLSDDDLFDTNRSQEAPSKLNKLNVLFLIVCLTVSGTLVSTTLKSPLPNVAIKTNKPLPNIQLYSSKAISLETSDKIHFIYHFDNKDLDGTPTFFDHKMIPENWTQVSKKQISNWNVHEVVNGTQKAIILTSYQMNNFKTSNASKFKIHRLKNGLLFPQKAKLHWVFHKCDKTCDINILSESLSN